MNTKPTTATAQAEYIWREQDRLNAACSPTGAGTLDHNFLAGKSPSRDITQLEQLRFDYTLALHDEAAELINNFIWKHWAKETKDGRRFQLIHPDAEKGEGTAQNVAVELTDIVFFTVSLLHLETSQITSIAHTWTTTWGSDANWTEARKVIDHFAPEAKNIHGIDRLKNLENNQLLLKMLALFEKNMAQGLTTLALTNLLEMFAAAGISRQQAFELYDQKLTINFERVLRGRKQVGDEHAHRENASLKA